MAFPPRPRSSRNEPSFAPVGAATREAVPLRPAAVRPAARPSLADTGGEREPLRLATEAPSLSLSASDRVVVTSGGAARANGSRREPSLLRGIGLALLLALAAVGAYSLYQWLGPYLP